MTPPPPRSAPRSVAHPATRTHRPSAPARPGWALAGLALAGALLVPCGSRARAAPAHLDDTAAPTPAGARPTVTVLAPVPLEPAAAVLAQRLGEALEGPLGQPGPYQPVNATAVPSSELVPMFGCARIDLACARRAGQAAGSDLVLYSEIGWQADGVVARLTLLSVGDGLPHRQGAWFVHPVSTAEAPGLRRALQAVAQLFLVQEKSVPLVLNATDAVVEVDGRRLGPGEVRVLTPGEARVEQAGHPVRLVELAAGEIVLVQPLAPAPGAATAATPAPARRTAAWITSGAAAGALVAAGVVGFQLASTRAAYDLATTGADVRHLGERGQTEATAVNVLLVGGGLLLGAAAWLWWGP